MAIGTIIIITAIAALAGIESVLDEWQWHRPILVCTLIGLVLGSLHTGLIVGGELELLALGWMNIGAAQSPDTALAGVLSTLLAIRAGHDVSSAIAIAVPIAIAGNLTTVFVRSLTISIHHVADRMALTSSRHYLLYLHFGALSLQALRVAIPALIFQLFVSQSMILNFLHAIPPVLNGGFTAASGFIVVVGYAMVIRSLHARELTPYLILGFLLADISSSTLLAIGLIGGSIAYLHVRFFRKASEAVLTNDVKDDTSITVPFSRLTKKVFWRIFWRSQFFQASWNYERMQGMGYAYAVEPALDLLYTKEESRIRKQEHLEFFNSQPYIANLVVGMNLAVEEKASLEEESARRLVSSIKLGMMGPLAGVGDSLFWGTLRPLIASLAATMALSGNVFGPVVFFVSWNVLRLVARYGFLYYGYRFGLTLVQRIRQGIIRQFTEGASILGLFVMGALVARWAHVAFAPSAIASFFTQLLPNLQNLVLLYLVLFLLRRRFHSVSIIFLLFVVACIGVALHVIIP
jgi:mannose/fructose/sorbose-specific phosphotransferase system IID component